ncbi:MAG: aspartate-semialdehyde dehydrogenase [Endomicrobium sp.]|jgi:aspartate-semialdehyde dehydrogenase|nr:aspartate-semialdehyde dehydrogenase [Endomicrobium sp.]
MNKKKYKIAIIGATGAVGLEIIKLLEKRNFPILSIDFFASKNSVGKKLIFNSREIKVKLLTRESGKGIDIAIFSAGTKIAKQFIPIFIKENSFVIDNSNAWRMDKNIPLVVPEVNEYVLNKNKKLIANPNCSTIQMVLVLKPLHDFASIKRIVVSTYQSVSGAGQRGINELIKQTKIWLKNKNICITEFDKFKYQIAFNLIPQIDIFTKNGYTKEEMKIKNETRKILNDDSIGISATCVRVPVFRSHSESIWIETKKVISLSKVKELLARTNGVCLLDDPKNEKYPMPIFSENKEVTYVGRIRSDISINSNRAFVLWVVSDNLLKGAALNAVQIAETLIKRKYV